MGLVTFADFKSYLKFRHAGNSAFDNYYGTWVNAGYRQLITGDRIWAVKRSLIFPELETSSDVSTVASTATIAKPTDCLIVREVYDATNNSHLDWMGWNTYVSQTSRYTSTAKPTMWNRRGGLIYLYPTPDAAYTMRVYYRKIPPVLSGASDVTVIGQEWDDIILALADFNSRMWNGEYDKAKIMKEEAIERIAGLLTIYDDESKARRERFRPDEQTYFPSY